MVFKSNLICPFILTEMESSLNLTSVQKGSQNSHFTQRNFKLVTKECPAQKRPNQIETLLVIRSIKESAIVLKIDQSVWASHDGRLLKG